MKGSEIVGPYTNGPLVDGWARPHENSVWFSIPKFPSLPRVPPTLGRRYSPQRFCPRRTEHSATSRRSPPPPPRRRRPVGFFGCRGLGRPPPGDHEVVWNGGARHRQRLRQVDRALRPFPFRRSRRLRSSPRGLRFLLRPRRSSFVSRLVSLSLPLPLALPVLVSAKKKLMAAIGIWFAMTGESTRLLLTPSSCSTSLRSRSSPGRGSAFCSPMPSPLSLSSAPMRFYLFRLLSSLAMSSSRFAAGFRTVWVPFPSLSAVEFGFSKPLPALRDDRLWSCVPVPASALIELRILRFFRLPGKRFRRARRRDLL